MKTRFYCFVFLLIGSEIFAQNTTILPDRVSVPKTTTATKNALPNKTEGMMVYDSNLQQFSYWTGTAWANFGSTALGTNGWQQIGNNINYTNNTSSNNANTTYTNATIFPIPDNSPTGVSSVINVPLTGTIIDPNLITISISLSHTFAGDIVATLISPNGNRFILLKGAGNGGNFVNTNVVSFNNTATQYITPPPTTNDPIPAGTYLPSGVAGNIVANLADLYAENISGNWTLLVQDISGADSGFLASWSINFGASAIGNIGKVGIGTSTPQSNLDVNGSMIVRGINSQSTALDVKGGIKTKYSGTLIQTTAGTGLQVLNFTIPAVPEGWDFTNTVVLMSIADGGSGSIDQAKLLTLTTIQVRQNVSAAGATRYNYIIFKL